MISIKKIRIAFGIFVLALSLSTLSSAQNSYYGFGAGIPSISGYYGTENPDGSETRFGVTLGFIGINVRGQVDFLFPLNNLSEETDDVSIYWGYGANASFWNGGVYSGFATGTITWISGGGGVLIGAEFPIDEGSSFFADAGLGLTINSINGTATAGSLSNSNILLLPLPDLRGGLGMKFKF